MKQIGDGLNFPERLLYQVDAICQALRCLGTRYVDGYVIQVHLEDGKILSYAVVKIDADSPSFLVLHSQDVPRELAQGLLRLQQLALNLPALTHFLLK